MKKLGFLFSSALMFAPALFAQQSNTANLKPHTEHFLDLYSSRQQKEKVIERPTAIKQRMVAEANYAADQSNQLILTDSLRYVYGGIRGSYPSSQGSTNTISDYDTGFYLIPNDQFTALQPISFISYNSNNKKLERNDYSRPFYKQLDTLIPSLKEWISYHPNNEVHVSGSWTNYQTSPTSIDQHVFRQSTFNTSGEQTIDTFMQWLPSLSPEFWWGRGVHREFDNQNRLTKAVIHIQTLHPVIGYIGNNVQYRKYNGNSVNPYRDSLIYHTAYYNSQVSQGVQITNYTYNADGKMLMSEMFSGSPLQLQTRITNTYNAAGLVTEYKSESFASGQLMSGFKDIYQFDNNNKQVLYMSQNFWSNEWVNSYKVETEYINATQTKQSSYNWEVPNSWILNGVTNSFYNSNGYTDSFSSVGFDNNQLVNINISTFNYTQFDNVLFHKQYRNSTPGDITTLVPTSANYYYYEDYDDGVHVKTTQDKINGAVIAFPNPVSNLLTIKCVGINKGHLQILSLDGKQLLQKDMNTDMEVLDVQHLPAGNYIVSVSTADGNYQKNDS